MIEQAKTIENQRNQIKAKEIKAFEMSIEEKMRTLEQSRLTQAHGNYEHKLISNMKKKKKLDRVLHEMKEKET